MTPSDSSHNAWDRELLDSLVAEGWLKSQRHPDADLCIYNYAEKCQYEKHWTPETLACRGLILDTDGQVVARPFGKFFNLGDPQVGEIPVGEPFTVTEKLDGSLGILYWLDGEPCIATRGSFASEQAVVGTQMIREAGIAQYDSTLLFEIIYPGNRIVVDYGSRQELVFLTAIDKVTGLDARGEWIEWRGSTALNFGQVPIESLQETAKPNSEGYVIAFESGLRVKVKFEEYVRLHKIITGVTPLRVWDILRTDANLNQMLEGVPDEVYGWLTDTRDDLLAKYAAAEQECQRVFDARPETDDRKTIALYFVGSGADTSVLFNMLDGKPYQEAIWKRLRPEPSLPDFAKKFSEATA